MESSEPGVIVDQDMQILHLRGQTGRFLEPAPDAASLSLVRMARPGLALDLHAAIHETPSEWAPARRKGAHVQTNGGSITPDFSVYPLESMLEEIIPQDTEFEDFELVHDFPCTGRKRAMRDAGRIVQEGELPDLVLLTVREVTDA